MDSKLVKEILSYLAECSLLDFIVQQCKCIYVEINSSAFLCRLTPLDTLARHHRGTRTRRHRRYIPSHYVCMLVVCVSIQIYRLHDL